jgi:hypothetical protein
MLRSKLRSVCHLVIGPDTINPSANRIKRDLPHDTHIFIAQEGCLPEGLKHQLFRPEKFLTNTTFSQGCDPMDIQAVIQFIQALDSMIYSTGHDVSQKIVCCAGTSRRSFTNTAFLLGAYIILKLNMKSSFTAYCFRGIDPAAFESFRDPGSSHSDFALSVLDCWNAIERAKACGWIGPPRPDAPFRWGLLDIGAYAHYNDPVNADLHEIVPGHLVAMRAPKDLGGRSFVDM